MKPLLDDADDDLVRHQGALVHVLLGLRPHGCTRLDRRAEHVAGGDLHDAVLFGEALGLRAFARGRGTKQDEIHDYLQ